MRDCMRHARTRHASGVAGGVVRSTLYCVNGAALIRTDPSVSSVTVLMMLYQWSLPLQPPALLPPVATSKLVYQ